MRLFAILVLVACAFIGWRFQDRLYRLNEPGQAADQKVLSHRDSAYTAISWVATPGNNTLQMRFFDRVEGGVCLHPTWTELAELSATVPGLAHLVPTAPVVPEPAERGWPAAWPLPDPGTVNASPYISLFPAGLLLNERLMAAAGGDLAKAEPRILIVGLGSGVGPAHLFHHIPKAKITVVDIDREVLHMVRAHYPLLVHMERVGALTLVAQDARTFIRYGAAGQPWDLVLLDAYTAGSTIPPHLMTREFFAQCAELVGEHGIVMANVIGSYGSDRTGTLVGQQHKVLGGAVRSMRAAQRADGTPLLPHAWVMPVFNAFSGGPSSFEQNRNSSRNNIVLASRQPLDPRGNEAGWRRLAAHVPLSGLPTGRWMSRVYAVGGDDWQSALIPATAIPEADAEVSGRFRTAPMGDGPAYVTMAQSDDTTVVTRLTAAVAAAANAGTGGLAFAPANWDRRGDRALRHDTDWVRLPREVWRVSVSFARQPTNGADLLVGPRDGDPARAGATWALADAPLFTDQKPNADIWNRQ